MPAVYSWEFAAKASRGAPSGGLSSGGGEIPNSPLWDTLTGGAGQFVAVWFAVETLVGGGDIAGDPISVYTVRWGTTEASVEEGGTPTGSTTTSSLTVTRTGLSAGTWWVSISATNGAGESDYSFAQSVTVS